MSKIAEIKSSFEAEVKFCVKISEVQDMKVKYLGKSGELTALLKEIINLPSEERPVFGAKVNELRNFIENALQEKLFEVKELEMQEKLQN